MSKIMDAVGFLSFVFLVMVGVSALLVGIGAAAVVSGVAFDATGSIHTSSAMVDTSTESILAITSGTNGRADISYSSSINARTMGTSLVSNAGTMQASSSVVGLTWHLGEANCDGTTCKIEPSTYTNVNAGSTITLTGAGSARTLGHVDTNLIVYDLDAMGTGSLSQYGNAISMAGVIEDNEVSGLTDYNYAERSRINGVFNYSSRFTFTP